MECTLRHSYDIPLPDPNPNGAIGTTLVLGNVQRITVRNDVLHPGAGLGTIDPVKLRAIARLGGNTYARIGDAFEVPRPVWKGDVETEYTKLVSSKDVQE